MNRGELGSRIGPRSVGLRSNPLVSEWAFLMAAVERQLNAPYSISGLDQWTNQL